MISSQKKSCLKILLLRQPLPSDPDWIRTNDPQLRRLMLYPTELPDHLFFINSLPVPDFKYTSLFLASILVSNSSKKNNVHGRKPLVDLVNPLLCCVSRT